MNRQFDIGDRVSVKNATSMFHTRTQAFTQLYRVATELLTAAAQHRAL